VIPLGLIRGHIAVARDRVGRLATLAGATALTAGAFMPDPFPFTGLAAIGTAAGGALWALTVPPGRVRDTALALYLAPSITMGAIATAERVIHGPHWWQLLADAAWAVAVWWLRPARTARVLAGREPRLTEEAIRAAREAAAQAAGQGGVQHPMADWWAQRVAIEGGVAPGTALVDVEQIGPKALRAVIRTTADGTPVPVISVPHLSALLRWPEEEIVIGPMPGRGANERRLTVGQAAADSGDLFERWSQHIAPKGMPGTVITSIRTVDVGTDGGVTFDKEGSR
jgi:hypothetical protein